MRLPFDQIYLEADRLIRKMVNAPFCLSAIYWDEYILFLEGCGWTNSDFDEELLKRVDCNWDDDNLLN